MIALDRVSYTYPGASQPALRDLSLEISQGSFVALVGANGAGKSTLCAALAGFVPHHFRGDLSGRVVVDGLDTSAVPLTELVSRVGLVFQNPLNQLSGARLTVADEVAFGLENLGVPRDAMLQRVRSALEHTGLADLARRSPYALSAGEMQRLALAAILVMEPRVLVLDEPAAQLDPAGARQVFETVGGLAAERRMTVVMAEQRVEWIAAFADRVIALKDGALVLDGVPKDVLADERLPRIGVAPPRYTVAARAARERGWWPAALPLPATLEAAAAGFRQARRGQAV